MDIGAEAMDGTALLLVVRVFMPVVIPTITSRVMVKPIQALTVVSLLRAIAIVGITM